MRQPAVLGFAVVAGLLLALAWYAFETHAERSLGRARTALVGQSLAEAAGLRSRVESLIGEIDNAAQIAAELHRMSPDAASGHAALPSSIDGMDVHLIAPDGRVLRSSAPLRDDATIAGTPLFDRIRSSSERGLFLLDVQTDPLTRRTTIPFARRISSRDGATIGYVVATMDPDVLPREPDYWRAAVPEDNVRDHTVLHVLDRDGRYLVRMQGDHFTLGDRIGAQALGQLVHESRSPRALADPIDGERRFSTFLGPIEHGISVGASVDEDAGMREPRAELREQRRLMLVASLAYLVIMGLIIAYIRALRRHAWRQRVARERLGAAHEASLDSLILLTTLRDASARPVDFRLIQANSRGYELLGLAPEGARGRTLRGDFPKFGQDGQFERFVEVAWTGRPNDTEIRRIAPDGSTTWLRQTIVSTGEEIAITIRDISERRAMQEAQEEQRSFLQALVDNLPVGLAIVVTDEQDRIVFANQTFLDSIGHSMATVNDLPAADFGVPGLPAEQVASGAVHDAHWQGESVHELPDGSEVPCWLTARHFPAAAGRRHLLRVWSDITPLKRTHHELEELAHHDALTGLANRTQFFSRIRQATERAEQGGAQIALFFVDLDGFKEINDQLGHQTGDDCLVAVASRLRAAVRPVDTVARLGGDEFAIIGEAIRDESDARRLESRIREAVNGRITLADRELRVSGSVGLQMFGSRAMTPEEALAAADAAMYAAKRARPRTDPRPLSAGSRAT